jgi:hypothetical protein
MVPRHLLPQQLLQALRRQGPGWGICSRGQDRLVVSSRRQVPLLQVMGAAVILARELQLNKALVGLQLEQQVRELTACFAVARCRWVCTWLAPGMCVFCWCNGMCWVFSVLFGLSCCCLLV